MELLHLYTNWKTSLGSPSAVLAVICAASYYLSINLLSGGLKIGGVLFIAVPTKKLFHLLCPNGYKTSFDFLCEFIYVPSFLRYHCSPAHSPLSSPMFLQTVIITLLSLYIAALNKPCSFSLLL